MAWRSRRASSALPLLEVGREQNKQATGRAIARQKEEKMVLYFKWSMSFNCKYRHMWVLFSPHFMPIRFIWYLRLLFSYVKCRLLTGVATAQWQRRAHIRGLPTVASFQSLQVNIPDHHGKCKCFSTFYHHPILFLIVQREIKYVALYFTNDYHQK